MTPPLDDSQAGTRDVLLNAALIAFGKYGYEATTIRLVASLAGKNASLLSYYFGNKEGLYRQVIQHLLARFTVCVPAAQEGETPRQRLRGYIHRLLQDHQDEQTSQGPEHHAARRLWLNELTAPRQEVLDLIRDHLAVRILDLAEVILAIRPGLSPQEVTFWGITLQGCCLTHSLTASFNEAVWPAPRSSPSRENLAERLADFVLAGLETGSGARP